MIAMTWFGKSAKEIERDKKTNAIVHRVVTQTNHVSSAAARLFDALDMSDSKMEKTLTRLVQARKAAR